MTSVLPQVAQIAIEHTPNECKQWGAQARAAFSLKNRTGHHFDPKRHASRHVRVRISYHSRSP
jgi:hypothetical protein